jgi:DNA replication and repair protein RecF
MVVEWLQIQWVRNLDNLQLTPHPKINVFVGKNASGKTAILESIYLLARARSFRTPRIMEVIQQKRQKLRVIARINHEKAGQIKTGLEKSYGQFSIRRNNEQIKTVSDQASHIPIVLITQDTSSIITGSPKMRRHWLDWAMFHVEPDYLEQRSTYINALRQRNQLLKHKEKNPQMYRGWEQAMVESAYTITAQRERFLEGLRETLKGVGEKNFTQRTELKLNPGWQETRPLLEVLEGSREEDRARGYSRSGIHSADIAFTLEGKKISASFSRGQIKLYAMFLMMAQAEEINKRTGVKPIILIDDFKAELDEENSDYLLTWLYQKSFQSFLTTTAISNKTTGVYQAFHVERGALVESPKG